jgi:hypothetical protein
MGKPFQISLRRMIGAVASVGTAASFVAPVSHGGDGLYVLLAIFGVPASIGAAVGFVVGAPLRGMAAGAFAGYLVLLFLLTLASH